MCGIAGFADLAGAQTDDPRGVLEAMTAALEHRGPDAGGAWHAPGVALGHRRLSIIDLAGGAQPMLDPETGCCVVFNGEIYNYLTINKELTEAGTRILSRSDTETLLKAYAAWGPECLSRFNGMFSFVLYDPRKRLFFAARDRMGKKPFYYSFDGRHFLFGSEAKALLKHPAARRSMDWQALGRFLIHEYVPAPFAIYEGMRKLPGGHWLTLDLENAKLTTGEFWDCDYVDREPHADAGKLEHWLPQLKQSFFDAVERRLISDVPLGAFLSGGLDSSAVVAAMAHLQGAKKVKTFSVGFKDPTYDESSHARSVAKLLGTEHHELMLHTDAALEIIPEIDALIDEPFADASILPTYLMTRYARQNITVALGGDGGDELFAGYDTFRAIQTAQRYNRLVPGVLDRYGFRLAARMLPVSGANFSFDFKVKRFLRGARVPEAHRLARWLGAFLPEELPSLLTPDALAKIDSTHVMQEVEDFHAKVAGCDAIARDLYLFTKTYMQDGVLVKVDRASMGCSLEVRSPLLDYEFVELANRMPSHLKYNGGKRLKYALKAVMEGLLPAEIIHRPKKGFGVPLVEWLRGPLREGLEDSLSEKRLREGGVFNVERVRSLMADHFAGRENHRKPLWALFRFQRWMQHWM